MRVNIGCVAGAAMVLVAGGYLSAAPLLPRASDEFINDVNATEEGNQVGSYEADGLPSTSPTFPKWNVVATGGTGQVNNGIFTYETITDPISLAETYYVASSGGAATPGLWADVNAATGYTVEFSLAATRVDDATRGAGLFRIADGVRILEMEFLDGSVVLNAFKPTAATFNVDTSEFHVYRVAWDPDAAKYSFWIDGKLESSDIDAPGSASKQLLLGDTSGSRYSGQVSLDYIRWDTSGAFSPVPEPASLGLLGTGALLMLGRRRAV